MDINKIITGFEKKLSFKIDSNDFYKALSVKCDREEVNNLF